MQYGAHQSQELLRLFRAQEFPHQGQNPRDASVIILGLDANYSPEISEDTTFFNKIVEYHNDGIAFWQKHGVHHPFLLPDYPLKKNTGGVPYHRRFSWMNLTSEFAPHISFVELLDIPTTGRTQWGEFWQLFSKTHARRIDRLISSGDRRLVLVSQSLMARYMSHAKRTLSVFPWLPKVFELGPLIRIGDTIILGAPHFSSTTYKKVVFEELGDTIRRFCQSV